MKGLALVTGASGFIGLALCRKLMSEGWRVRVLMRRPAAGPWEESLNLELGRQSVPSDLLAGVDVIFHLAGRTHALAEGPGAEEEYRLANIQSTRDLLEAAAIAGIQSFIYFSSVKATVMARESDVEATLQLLPDSPYGRSKHAAEEVVLRGGAVPHPVVLRPSLVYGPHPKGYLAQMIRAVRAGWFPPLPDLGNARSMVHRDDLVEAALLCASDPRARGRTYVVTDGIPYSTRQIYEFILTALGRNPPRWTVPIGLLRLAALAGDQVGRWQGRRFLFDSEILDKVIGSAWYDGEAIRRELGFVPQRTLRDSMAEMVATS